MCGFPVQAFSQPPVDLGERIRECVVRHLREVCSFREELAQEPVGVLVAPPLPRCVRVGEIHRHAERRLDAFVTAELFATVRRRRLERAVREGDVHRMDRPLHRGRGAVRDRQGEIEPALPLDERRDARLRFPSSGDDGVELPVPERPAPPDLWRPFRDGESDVDAPARLGRLLTFPLLAEHGQGHVDPSRVDPSVDGGEGNFLCVETADDLFRGPGRTQLLDDRPAHRVIEFRFGAAVGLRLLVAFLGTFSHVVWVPSDLPRDGRGLSPEPSRDGPDGHPELQIGLYFHAFRCGKMGVAHAISSV